MQCPSPILRGLDEPVRDREEAAIAVARRALIELRTLLHLPLPFEDRVDRAIDITGRALVAIDTLIPPPAPE